ncbi:MAG: CDGSH iron-sulfur domain-containing protein [Vulcanimicrobiaceae bacterium]
MSDELAAITPKNNGPYYIRGKIRIVLPSGAEIETEDETWLCRCGHSKDKPFCDGSHREAGFRASEEDEHAHRG